MHAKQEIKKIKERKIEKKKRQRERSKERKKERSQITQITEEERERENRDLAGWCQVTKCTPPMYVTRHKFIVQTCRNV